VVWDESRGAHRVTHNAVGAVLVVPSWVLFSTGGTGGSGDTSPHGAALSWGTGNTVNMQ